MRITSSMYYNNIQAESSKANERLFDVNKQISSGLKIQYANDDVNVFTQTMKLDNELASLGQIVKSSESGYKMSNQADTILNDFELSMNRVKTLLVQAASSAQSDNSLDAVGNELRGLETHLKNLANTSINGQYLFSGSAIDVKPIDSKGVYQGNDVSMNAFVGAGVVEQYNLTGANLFLGEEALIKRQITSNVPQYNLSAKYPDFSDPQSVDNGISKSITSEDTIRDLMGDIDDVGNTASHFYLRGATSDGTSFNKHITMNDTETVEELLTQIGNAYGNTSALDLVNVSLNNFGEIVIEDKMKGSSKLEFHMVGAVDYNQNDLYDAADIHSGIYGINAGNIDNLDNGESDFDQIMNNSSSAVNSSLYVKEFVKSPFASVTATKIDAILYDRTQFSKEGSTLSSSTPQILKETNAFATPSTKISEVADLSQGTSGTLSGTRLVLKGTNVHGVAYSAEINFSNTSNGGSTFSLDGGITNYNIFNMDTPRTAVDADKMTYKQLMDVTNMLVTGTFPATDNTSLDPIQQALDYDKAIESSTLLGGTFLSYDGKIQFKDEQNNDTNATLAIYDSNSGNFSADASVMTFNSNNALTVRDPKTDFFKELNTIITSVEEHKLYPDASNGDKRSVGIQNSIAMIDDLMNHVSRTHSSVGAQSNSLTNSLERAQLLEISTMTLRSSVLDTDLAEASLTLTQLSLSYQAMLSTVAKVSKLSLVNYL